LLHVGPEVVVVGLELVNFILELTEGGKNVFVGNKSWRWKSGRL